MFNNPFMYQSMYRPSLLSRLFGGAGAVRSATSGISWGNILTTAQKSLGVINQAIPLVHQVRPMITNAKTMFKIADALKGDKRNTNTKVGNRNTTVMKEETSSQVKNENKPIFYI